MNEEVQRVFDILRGLKQDYQLTFPRTSPSAQRVLQDLSRFCYATASFYNADEKRIHTLLGRNEVWKRIQENINLSAQDLYRLKTGQQLSFEEPHQ